MLIKLGHFRRTKLDHKTHKRIHFTVSVERFQATAQSSLAVALFALCLSMTNESRFDLDYRNQLGAVLIIKRPNQKLLPSVAETLIFLLR